jgi:RNA polymerase sigma factor (sigma-70 family)
VIEHNHRTGLNMSSADRGTVLQRLDRLFTEGTLAGLGDGELLDRFRTRRDEAAFEALVELHGPMVLGLCRRFLRDPRDIEDAFQATFLVLVQKAPSIRDGGLLSSWLYGVALRVATRARANLLGRRAREQALGKADFPAEPAKEDRPALGPVFDQELSRLPAKYRAPLVLCYLRGQTHDQAASALCCPVGTVRSRMARGRDLLRRRLTNRGYVPSVVLLGLGLDGPSHLLTTAVPERLVAATVQAACAIGSMHAMKTGAVLAPALVLTQGVVTSMKFAQLKWIGLGLLATGLSAGGAVVVAAMSAQSSGAAGQAPVAAVSTAEPSQEGATDKVSTSTATATSGSSKTTEDRLHALEQQVDRIYRLSGIAGETEDPRIGPATPTLDRLEAKLQFLLSRHDRPSTSSGTGTSSTSTSIDRATSSTSSGSTVGARDLDTTNARAADRPATSSSVTSTRDFATRASTERPGSSARIRELEAQLKQAITQKSRIAELHQRAVVSEQTRVDSVARVEATIATLRGMDDDFNDELEEAKLVVKRKKAELEEALAQVNGANALVARNTRLNERQPGMVSAEDVVRAESGLGAASAHTRVKDVELEEADLQCRKLQRWRARIQEVLNSNTKIQ